MEIISKIFKFYIHINFHYLLIIIIKLLTYNVLF